ncbi:MAG TPA: hypothetical protein VK726_16445 [Acetobacteraceae bacterium]|nr:hypothetical protein [Acetobacteraceae bacterium]
MVPIREIRRQRQLALRFTPQRAPRHEDVGRYTIMQHDHRIRLVKPLGVGEVPQQICVSVHAIQKCQVDRPLQQTQWVVLGKQRIAGGLKQQAARLSADHIHCEMHIGSMASEAQCGGQNVSPPATPIST